MQKKFELEEIIQELYEAETMRPKGREEVEEESQISDHIDSREIVGIVQRECGVRMLWRKDSSQKADKKTDCEDCPYEGSACKLK